MTSKERAYFRRLANGLAPIFQIGKSEITDNFVLQIDQALEARELIKIHILQNASYDPREVSHELAHKTNAEVIQVIGSKFVLYRKSQKETDISRLLV